MLLRVRPGPYPTRFMETLGQHPHQRFSGSDRLFGLFSLPESATAGLELHEVDIFGSESPNSPMAKNLNPNPNPNPDPNPTFRRFAAHNFGILAALPDRNPNPNLMPKFSISCSSSSAMAIPPSAKAKQEKVYRSSAPVSIPVVNVRKNMGRGSECGLDGIGDEDDEEMLMLQPHEIVARREGRESSPMTTFSVLEGVGRTLKGRDLRRVRNAVFRRTGFED